jgi:hypothetical protein
MKRRATDAQSGAVKSVGYQTPETADAAQTEPDVARDEADVAGTAPETEVVETSAEPGDAQTEQPDAETPTASEVPAGPTLDTNAALALRRLHEQPRCCCGCGRVLSSPKKHFIQGHNGKAEVIVPKNMRGELQPQEAPTELILRHMEIKFIMRSPEFRRVAEMWREICGLSRAALN